MGAYKKLNKQDVYITSYEANKSYQAVGDSEFTTFDIDGFYVESSSGAYYVSPFHVSTGDSGATLNRYTGYKGLYQLYYSNFISQSLDTGQNLQSGSFDNFIMSSLATGSYKTGFRVLPNKANVFSVPRKHSGAGIKPNSFVLSVSGAAALDSYSSSYFASGTAYIEDGADGLPESSDDYIQAPTPEELLRSGPGAEIVDDGEGNLVISASDFLSTTGSFKVGDIIYPHGLFTLTSGSMLDYYRTDLDFQWKASHPIYTYNIRCQVKDHELNFTQHPSAITGSEGILHNNVTGSAFQPYITTVGLYNDSNELLAVAKFGQPIPKSDSTEMTFVVKLDM